VNQDRRRLTEELEKAVEKEAEGVREWLKEFRKGMGISEVEDAAKGAAPKK
jgi:uncharacterized protein YgfB (UPF0149 family)